MAKKNRGSKNRSTSPANQPKPGQTVINDFGIQIQQVDTTRKDLNKWRTAYEHAISPIRPIRQPLIDLYTNVLLDDHLTSVTKQRRLAVTNTTIVFQKDGNPVDSINLIAKSECFNQLLIHAVDKNLFGYSLIHADFRNDLVELVDRRHVNPIDRIVTANPYDDKGIDYTSGPYKNYYVGVGDPHDLGLLLIAAPLVLIKRGNLSDWAGFNELFGQPMRIGTYDPHMPGNKKQLLDALEQAGALAYIAVPTGSKVEFVDANKTGATTTYDTLYERMEKGLSKLIVGQTMTTEDGSSESQANVHERVAQAIAQDDRQFITRLLNGRVRDMLIAQGFPEAANGEFQFVDEEATISKKDRLAMDLSIHKDVAPIRKEYFEQEYNVEFDPEEEKRRQEEKAKADKQKLVPTQKEDKEKTKLALSFYERFLDFFA